MQQITRQLWKVLIGALLIALLIASATSRSRTTGRHAFRSYIAHLSQGDFSKAEININRAIEHDPQNAYYIGGLALLNARRVETEQPLFRFENTARIWDSAASVHIEAGIEQYQRAIALNPRDGAFRHNLGWLYQFLDRRQEAKESLRQAVSFNPDVPLYHLSLGLLLESEHNANDAFDEYLTAIKLSPTLVDSEFFSDLDKRRPLEVKKLISRALSELSKEASGGDPIIKSKLGKLYVYVGQKAAAQRILSETIAELPSLSKPWVMLGDGFAEAQSWEEMLRCYYKATFLDRSDFVPWARIANYFDETGQEKRAIGAYRRALFEWQNQSSVESKRAGRIYRTPSVIPDDVIPRGLLAYSAPRLDAHAMARRLSELYLKNGDSQSAKHFEAVSVRILGHSY